MSDMVKRLKRNPERWAAMNMTAVMEGSPAQALFALEDAKADIATLAAELSRLSALVAEWQKAGAEAEAQMMALYISVSPHATYERDGKIGNPLLHEVGGVPRHVSGSCAEPQR